MDRLYILMEEWSKLMETGHTPPVDLFPWLKAIPERLFGNYKPCSLAVGKQMKTLYESIQSDVQSRREKGEPKLKSLIDLVLDQQDKIQLPQDKLRVLGRVLMERGTDTSSSLILAIIQALLKNPVIQVKAQREIDAIIKEDRSPV